jgi:hypothetical protein
VFLEGVCGGGDVRSATVCCRREVFCRLVGLANEPDRGEEFCAMMLAEVRLRLGRWTPEVDFIDMGVAGVPLDVGVPDREGSGKFQVCGIIMGIVQYSAGLVSKAFSSSTPTMEPAMVINWFWRSSRPLSLNLDSMLLQGCSSIGNTTRTWMS